MMKNLFKPFLESLLILTLMLTLSACGGGNGPAGDPMGDGNLTSDGTIKLSLADRNGRPTNTIPLDLLNPQNSYLNLTANVLDGDANPVAGLRVTFSVDAIGVFSPTTTALTDNNGNAVIVLRPANINSSGVGQVTASATVTTKAITDTIDFCYNANCPS